MQGLIHGPSPPFDSTNLFLTNWAPLSCVLAHTLLGYEFDTR